MSTVDENGYYQGTGPADRVRNFLDTRAKDRMADPELIHSYGRDGVIHQLRVSDLRELLRKVKK